LLLAASCGFVACNKGEQDPFTGKDGFIAAFSLKQGNATFAAAIADDVISITAPEGLSLTQAKATVKLSENATIYPDPATITDWDEERQFVVTAYNGVQTKYKYTVKRSGLAHNGSVILETQDEVDAFGQQGVTFIDGNLTIGRAAGADSVTSLAPLADLKEVGYTFTIQPTCAIARLEGLENLENVGGILQISALKHLEILTLPALKTAGSIIVQNTVTFIAEFPELERVSKLFSLNCPLYQLQLPNLKFAGSLTLAAASNASTSLAKIALPALEEVEGNITVSYLKSVTKLELPELKKLGGFSFSSMTQLSFIYTPKLEEVTGTMNFPSLSVTELNFPALKNVNELTVSSKISVLDVSNLETVKTLTLSGVYVNGVAGFDKLKTAGTITLTNLPNGTKVEIPASVERIDVLSIGVTTDVSVSEVNITGKDVGVLKLTGAAIQTKIVGDNEFSGLLSLEPPSNNSELRFPELNGLSEIDSLYVNSSSLYNLHVKGIRKVRKGIYLYSTSSALRELSMPDMEEIGGNATISFTSMVNTADDMDSIKLDKLKSVGGNFTLAINTRTAKVLHCPELETVKGYFNLSASYDYSAGSSNYRGFEVLNFPLLKSIGEKLTIHSGSTSRTNTKLLNLDGFKALTQVKAIEVSRQAALVSYEGLQGSFPLASPENWSATGNGYNPTYQELLNGQWTKP
jgi:hypothetical protein